MRIDLQIQLSPSWWYRNYGFCFDETYYFNAENKLNIDKKMKRKLKQRFPEIPQECVYRFLSTEIAITFQPMVIFMAACGSRIRFFKDKDPWAERILDSKEDMETFEVPDLKSSPFLSKIEEQFDYYASKYNPEDISIYGTRDTAVIHSTITVAYHMIGEILFVEMLNNPKLVHKFLEKINNLNAILIDFFARKRRVKKIGHIHFGDCIAGILSPELYHKFGTRYKEALLLKYDASCNIHSCGVSTHLMEEFVNVPRVQWVEVGWGTELKIVKQNLSKNGIRRMDVLLDPSVLLQKDKQAIIRDINNIINICYPYDLTIRTGAIEYGTPEENIQAICNIVRRNIN